MSAIYRKLIHRMNQTAHISLQIPSISNNVETISAGCALTSLARPASTTSNFSASLRFRSCLAGRPRRSVWRPVVRLSAAGEGGSKVYPPNPQALFSPFIQFFWNFKKSKPFQIDNGMTPPVQHSRQPVFGTLPATQFTIGTVLSGGQPSYPQSYPGNHASRRFKDRDSWGIGPPQIRVSQSQAGARLARAGIRSTRSPTITAM